MPEIARRRHSLDNHFDEEEETVGATYDNFGDEDFDDMPMYDYGSSEVHGGGALQDEEAAIAADAAYLLHEATHLNGTLSTYADQSRRDERVHRARTTTSVRELTAAALAGEEAAEVACRQERVELERLSALRANTAARETDLLELRAISETKPNLAQVSAAEGRWREAHASEVAQAHVADAAFDAARTREKERDATLLDLTHERHRYEAMAHTEAAEAGSLRLAAPERARREREAAQRVVAQQRAVSEREVAEEMVREEQAARQLDAARVGHKRAVTNLRERVRVEREAEGVVDEGRMAELDKRAEAVIALKASTEAAAAEMRSANAKRAERDAAVAKAREAEKAAILAKGGNPYQVFRQRDEDARMARERKRVAATLDANMTALQGRIVRDYQTEAKERETSAAHKAAIEEKVGATTPSGPSHHLSTRSHSLSRCHSHPPTNLLLTPPLRASRPPCLPPLPPCPPSRRLLHRPSRSLPRARRPPTTPSCPR